MLQRSCSPHAVLHLKGDAQDAALHWRGMIWSAWVLPPCARVPASSFPLHSSLPEGRPAKIGPLVQVVSFEHFGSPGWFLGWLDDSRTREGGTQPLKLWWDDILGVRAGCTEPADDQNAPFLSINSPLPSRIAKPSNNSKFSVMVSNRMAATISQWCYRFQNDVTLVSQATVQATIHQRDVMETYQRL